MLLHAVMWSELPHTLDFCSEVYSTQNRHKDLSTHSRVYLHGDVRTTAEVWWNLKKEVEKDKRSWEIYEKYQRPLLPILLEAHTSGIRLDKKFQGEVAGKLREKVEAAKCVANEFVQGFSKKGKKRTEQFTVDGDDTVYERVVMDGAMEPDPTRTVNMNSPKQMNEWVYGHCGLKIPYLRRSRKSGMYPLGKDELAKLQDQFLPRDDDDTFETRLAQGGHPLVEAKAEFTQADKFLVGYINPYVTADRIYPQFKIHGQATGRWSTTNPNVPGMNKLLKPLLIPDVGTCWVGGDWSNAELRIMAELSDDKMLKTGFEKGWDLHSMHAAQAFGWDSPKGRWQWATDMRKIKGSWTDWRDKPMARGAWWGCVDPKEWKSTRIPADHSWEQWVLEGGPQPGWQADEDLFRRFCKVLVFRLMYRAKVKSAATIPGAASLGLLPTRLVKASSDLVAAHPCWSDWWAEMDKGARDERIVRNPNGRARRLLANDDQERIRAGTNFPIQSWVADLLNDTIIRVKEKAPWSVLKYTCHDSFYFQCPIDKRDELMYIVSKAAETPLRGDFYIPFDLECVRYDEENCKRIKE